MGLRGRKPTATVLKLLAGNPGGRPLPRNEPDPRGPVERPSCLRKGSLERRLWDSFIARAFWLTWADSPKAHMWCCLYAEFQRSPRAIKSARIAQLRALGSELGMDPAARSRLDVRSATRDPADEFFHPPTRFFRPS